MRVTTTVTHEELFALTQQIDPAAPGYAAHLPFDAILRRCASAWLQFLADIPGMQGESITPHIEVDFHREVGTGTLDVTVTPTRIGSSSFTVICTVEQDGHVAAHVSVVLVRFDYSSGTPKPLTSPQRRALEQRLVREATALGVAVATAR